MGAMIDPRIDFNGVGVQRGQRYMQKLIQVRPPPPGSYHVNMLHRNHCYFFFLKPFTVFFCFGVFPRIRKKEIVHPRIPNPGLLENNQLSILRCELVRASDIRIGP